MWDVRRHPGRALSLIFGVAVLFAACQSPAPQTNEDAGNELAVGEDRYREHCEVCHGGEAGGDIADVPPPHNRHGHTWHHGDCWLLDMIMDGNDEMRQQMLQQQGVPAEDSIMPSFSETLSESEARAILAFIKTWWTDEQREHQERVTQDVCG